MKKRFVSALTLLAILLTLCGCGPTQPSVPISLDNIPEYSGSAYVTVNEGIPFFEDGEIVTESFEQYSELDSLGRCGVATACIGIDIMPDDDVERGSLSSVSPSGWEYGGVSNNNEYDASLVENRYIYNRSHLIGHQLAGEDANEKNLITGTRYMNVEGMLPFENMVADYVEETENHVLYRVTPLFSGNELVARGVLMEAMSAEDRGKDLQFCVYIYNVQPGVYINYQNGKNCLATEAPDTDTDAGEDNSDVTAEPVAMDYVINKSSKKFHKPDCSGVKNMKEENKEERHATRDEMITGGYDPCGTCKP